MILQLQTIIIFTTINNTILFINIMFLVCALFLLYFQTALPAMSDHMPLIVLFYRLLTIKQIYIPYSHIFSNTAALVGIAIVLNVTCISLARERR